HRLQTLRRGRDRLDIRHAESGLDQHLEADLLLDVDDLGLDAMDRRYLSAIAMNYGGGPVGVETMAAALSEPRDAIEEIIEPYLLQQGFLQRTPRGRMLTAHAYRHLGVEAPTTTTQMPLFDGTED
ncbi:Holliday junction DNA helicase RuvB C-terminal domain-containing protein, partial [Hansschlegelia beijingensis]